MPWVCETASTSPTDLGWTFDYARAPAFRSVSQSMTGSA